MQCDERERECYENKQNVFARIDKETTKKQMIKWYLSWLFEIVVILLGPQDETKQKKVLRWSKSCFSALSKSKSTCVFLWKRIDLHETVAWNADGGSHNIWTMCNNVAQTICTIMVMSHTFSAVTLELFDCKIGWMEHMGNVL